MLPVLGHVAIVVGLAVSLFGAAAFVLGGRSRDPALVAVGRRSVYLAFGLAALASLAMVMSLLTHDFSVLYVARNNATTTPPFFSVISLWAALEGSILFWTLLASGWTALVLHRLRNRHAELLPWAGATLAGIGAFFFAVMAWPSNPFTRVTPVALEGPGPNALLQNHPFMGLHPPLLYLGYTGLAVPFAFALAALLTRRTRGEWLGIVRRWTLVPWTLLTLGIVAGAWWSYEVLGWGGYWAWDPVENAALLPWLTATAFLHSSIVAERRGSLRIWTLLLVIVTFALTLLGTLLTRSNLVESVHAFTTSAIGHWFAAAFVASLGVGLGLLVWRLPELGDRPPPGRFVSRDSAFLANNVLFCVLTFTVLLGTLLPPVVEALDGERISVGAPWFNSVNAPVLVALLFLMGVGPALPWGGASWRTLQDRFALPLLLAALTAAVALLTGVREPMVLATWGLAVFAAAVVLDEVRRGAVARSRSRGEPLSSAAWRLATRNRRRYGGYTVHLGVLVAAVAIAAGSAFGADTVATLRPGETTSLRGYELAYRGLEQGPLRDDPRVLQVAAAVEVSGAASGELRPSVRHYPSSSQPIGTPAVRTTAGEDLYLTLAAYDTASGSVTLHIFVRPLVAWIWIGGGIAGLGALFALWPERRPRSAAAREARPFPVERSPERRMAAEPAIEAATAEAEAR
jgi:cytochrome c-type biogenesis protein CcmF